METTKNGATAPQTMKAQALAVRESMPLTPGGSLEPRNMDELMQASEMLARSSLIPAPLRGKPADVAIVLMHGRELGLSPMRALSQVYVVEGKPSASADLMVALCLRQQGLCHYFRPVEVTEKIATYETRREGSDPVRFSYTIEDATRAGLAGRGTWRAHPKAMLSARCKSSLARMVYPDVVGGMYDPDEAEDIRATAQREAGRQRTAAIVERAEQAKAERNVTPEPTAIVEPAPAHDPQTGEVEQPADAGPSYAFARLSDEIAKAQSQDRLNEIAKAIREAKDAGDLLPGERERLSEVYKARKVAIERGQ